MTAPVTRFDAERAVHLTLGAASPLWPAYFVAASSGVALWWMSRWTSPFLEAKPAAPPTQPIEMTAVVEIPSIAEASPEPSPAEAASAGETPKPAAKARPRAANTALAPAPRTPSKRAPPKT